MTMIHGHEKVMFVVKKIDNKDDDNNNDKSLPQSTPQCAIDSSPLDGSGCVDGGVESVEVVVVTINFIINFIIIIRIINNIITILNLMFMIRCAALVLLCPTTPTLSAPPSCSSHC